VGFRNFHIEYDEDENKLIIYSNDSDLSSIIDKLDKKIYVYRRLSFLAKQKLIEGYIDELNEVVVKQSKPMSTKYK